VMGRCHSRCVSASRSPYAVARTHLPARLAARLIHIHHRAAAVARIDADPDAGPEVSKHLTGTWSILVQLPEGRKSASSPPTLDGSLSLEPTMSILDQARVRALARIGSLNSLCARRRCVEPAP